MTKGATPTGTARFAAAQAAAEGFYRQAGGLHVSAVGLGTYLGEPSPHDDELYAEAISEAFSLGCNFVDTAVNYRYQRSERVIGKSLQRAIEERRVTREEVVICTKGGYLPFDADLRLSPKAWVEETLLKPGVVRPDEIIAGCHCLAPSYLEHQIGQSLSNLEVETLDVYYLHNPEQQLDEKSPEDFYQTLEQAFELLEREAANGRLQTYGLATWSGFRVPPDSPGYLSLERAIAAAEAAGGKDHHFRWIQLPLNMFMLEALTLRSQSFGGEHLTLLEAARAAGLNVVASASLCQARLAHGLPAHVRKRIPDLETDAQRAVQFVRSTPGITVALVGMKQRGHVEENLALRNTPPLSKEAYDALFSTSAPKPPHERAD